METARANPSDIAWGIKETLTDPDRAKEWGINGGKRVLQYFTWREAAEQILRIYETIQHPRGHEEFKLVDFVQKLTRT